jgi:hypothetical protein
MRPKLLARLERLEARAEPAAPVIFRYGWLTPLPADFTGERHVVIVKREPTNSPNVEWCEFEERRGAAATEGSDDSLTVYLTR